MRNRSKLRTNSSEMYCPYDCCHFEIYVQPATHWLDADFRNHAHRQQSPPFPPSPVTSVLALGLLFDNVSMQASWHGYICLARSEAYRVMWQVEPQHHSVFGLYTISWTIPQKTDTFRLVIFEQGRQSPLSLKAKDVQATAEFSSN